MTYGITATGFNRKTFDNVVSDIETRLRESLEAPRLNVRDPKGILASIVLPLADEIARVWELQEATYNALDPNNSTGQTYSAVAQLRGVPRKMATIGTHAGMTFTFDDAVTGTVARGDVRFHPVADPSNVWINSEDFVIGSPGDYVIATESELTGSDKTFEASSTVVIVAGPGELTAIAVPTDAVAGTDLETEVAWRQRSDAALQAQGTTPLDALTAEVEAVPGVVNARIIESAGYIRVIIADGGGDADNDAVAQAIWSGKAGGTLTLGAITGTATDAFGEEKAVKFDRADEIAIYVSVIARAPNGASVADIKAAIQAKMPTRSGAPVVYGKLYSGAISVAGVEDVTSFFVGTAPSPTGEVNILVDETDLALLDADDISVTVVT